MEDKIQDLINDYRKQIERMNNLTTRSGESKVLVSLLIGEHTAFVKKLENILKEGIE